MRHLRIRLMCLKPVYCDSWIYNKTITHQYLELKGYITSWTPECVSKDGAASST